MVTLSPMASAGPQSVYPASVEFFDVLTGEPKRSNRAKLIQGLHNNNNVNDSPQIPVVGAARQ
jgi:hypothetical protein